MVVRTVERLITRVEVDPIVDKPIEPTGLFDSSNKSVNELLERRMLVPCSLYSNSLSLPDYSLDGALFALFSLILTSKTILFRTITDLIDWDRLCWTTTTWRNGFNYLSWLAVDWDPITAGKNA